VPPLLSIEEAQRRVLEWVTPLPPERVPLASSAGRVLAEDAVAVVDLPPFDASAMDGFAVRAEDTPGSLRVVARIAAGRPVAAELQPGEAFAIATGGAVPDGADAVVPIEEVVESGNILQVGAEVRPGSHVRPRGGDVRRGDVVVEKGNTLGAAQLGGLAAAGVAAPLCSRSPRAFVLGTGTELRAPGEELSHGEIYDANGVILEAQLRSAGAEPERLESVPDDPGRHQRALADGLAGDVLVTSGGVSVGPHDLVRAVGAELGIEEVFWGVAMKPGKPLWFGVRGNTLVFGLPGNPVSSLVCFELFVRPAVLALQGHSSPLPRFEPGLLATAVRPNPARTELVRARMRAESDGVALDVLTGRDSHMIARAAAADALVLVPAGTRELPARSSVSFLRLA